jgi:hypothetical protein
MSQLGPQHQPGTSEEVIAELARLKDALDPAKSDEDCRRWAEEAYPDIKTQAYYYSQLYPSSSDNANWDAARRDILKGITANELKEIETQIRSMVQHENDLLNHRIQWFLIINGFLLTATASLKSKPSDDTYVMLIILAVVGLFICISFWFSLGIGRRGVGRLANMWQHYRDLFYRSEAPTGCHQIGVLGWRANE